MLSLVPASSICMGIYRHVVLSQPYGATVNRTCERDSKDAYRILYFFCTVEKTFKIDTLISHHNILTYITKLIDILMIK